MNKETMENSEIESLKKRYAELEAEIASLDVAQSSYKVNVA